jgi:copper homeostasis protein
LCGEEGLLIILNDFRQMVTRSKMIILEACVDTLENALRAEQNGANRIELCSHLELEGLTPDSDLLESAFKELTIPIHVMIRPRDGNHEYSSDELEQMIKDIRRCKELGAAGVVIGAVHPNGKVDKEATSRLAAEASPMKVIFHKAIDNTPDILEAVLEIRSLPGVTGILSSGGAQTAEEGLETLKKMLALAGPDLEIIAAGKITKENLDRLHHELRARAYHGKKIV